MGGAQPLAVTMNDGVAICIECDQRRIQRRIEHRYLDVQADSLEHARRARASRPATRGGRCRSACSATPPRCCPAAARAGRARSTSSPTRPRRTTRCSTCRPASTFDDWERERTEDPARLHQARAGVDGRATCGRWSSSRTRAPRSSTTATRSATRPARAATTGPSSSPASCRRTSGRCSARARARSAGPRSPATPPTSPRPTGRSSSCSRDNERLRQAGSPWPASGCSSRGCRPGSAGSGTASATWPG